MAGLEGLRVVRGPNWKYGDQDGGEGGVGTVVDVGLIGVLGDKLAEAENMAKGLEELASTKEQKIRLSEALDRLRARANQVVQVIWDSRKKKNNYRVGLEGAFDLRVLDSSLTGVKHTGVQCTGKICSTELKSADPVLNSTQSLEDSLSGQAVGDNRNYIAQGISGIRWECANCSDNFCVKCFLTIQKTNSDSENINQAAQHDKTHLHFKCYEKPDSIPFDVVLDAEKRIPLKGIFVGATVKRGMDWNNRDEDGNGFGEVIKNKSLENGKVEVRWFANHNSFSYRRGLDGKVDLVAVAPQEIGLYQPDSLPVLKNGMNKLAKIDSSDVTRRFSAGDRVRIIVESVEILREKQMENCGGWDPVIQTVIGIPGTVVKVEKSSVHVEYEGLREKWPIDPSVLERLSPFSIGQIVRVMNDKSTIEDMQNKFGDHLTFSILKAGTGQVIQINDDGAVFLEMMNHIGSTAEMCPDWIQPMIDAPKHHQKLFKLKSKLAILLVESAGEGDLEVVEELVKHYQTPVDAGNEGGVSALHMACFKGHKKIIDLLLKEGASLEMEDKKGRRTIHFAAKGCQPDVLNFLIKKKVELGSVTRKKSTALQIAVEKQNTECIRILLAAMTQLEVNLADSDGDTPLHNAVLMTRNCSSNQVPGIILTLVESGKVILTNKNKKGFNVFHLAVVTSNFCVAKYLLDMGGSRLAVERITDNQSTALHIACYVRNFKIVELLVKHIQMLMDEEQNGMMEIDEPSTSSSSCTRNREQNESFISMDPKASKGITPLMIACFKNDYAIVESLVKSGANIDATDMDGDPIVILTAMKMRINMKKSKAIMPPTDESSPDIFKLYRELSEKDANIMGKHPSLSIICYLIAHGKNSKVTNKRGQTVLNIIEDPSVKSFVQSFSNKIHDQQDAASGAAHITPATVYCIICSISNDPISFPGCGCSCEQVCSSCASSLLYRCPICNGLNPNVIGQCQKFSNPSNDYSRGVIQPTEPNIANPLAEFGSIMAGYNNKEIEPQNPLQDNNLPKDILDYITNSSSSSPAFSGSYPSFSNGIAVGPPQFPINQVVLTNNSHNATTHIGNTGMRFKGSPEGKDLRLVDAQDNEYSRLTQRPKVWQCTKQGKKGEKSANRCPATFKEIGSGNFSPGKASHTCRNKSKLKGVAG